MHFVKQGLVLVVVQGILFPHGDAGFLQGVLHGAAGLGDGGLFAVGQNHHLAGPADLHLGVAFHHGFPGGGDLVSVLQDNAVFQQDLLHGVPPVCHQEVLFPRFADREVHTAAHHNGGGAFHPLGHVQGAQGLQAHFFGLFQDLVQIRAAHVECIRLVAVNHIGGNRVGHHSGKRRDTERQDKDQRRHSADCQEAGRFLHVSAVHIHTPFTAFFSSSRG